MIDLLHMLLFPFYDNHRSKPCLAVIPWKSPEDRLNLSSEDKPDDQVKPLTPLPQPPPPLKKKTKIQDVILVTPQKYILNAQGAYNHPAGVHTGLSKRTRDQGFPIATKSMTPVYLHKERKREGKDIPSCSISRLLIAYNLKSQLYIFYLYHSQICLTLLQRLRFQIKCTMDKVIKIHDNNLK